MRGFFVGMVVGAAILAAAWLARGVRRPRPEPPVGPAFVEAVREAARLEALEVRLHQVVAFVPDPPPAESLGASLKGWLKELVRPEEGKAMVFATARYLVDLSRLDDKAVEVRGQTAYVRLPPVTVTIELEPGETVVLSSTLGPGGETALLARAKDGFLGRARSDARLLQKANAAARRAVAHVAARFGVRQVVFDEPAAPEGGRA